MHGVNRRTVLLCLEVPLSAPPREGRGSLCTLRCSETGVQGGKHRPAPHPAPRRWLRKAAVVKVAVETAENTRFTR
jgi:hypothetical protein